MVTQPQFCENCGATLAPDVSFCESCGSRIAPPPPVPPAREPPKAVPQPPSPPPAEPASWKGAIWKIVGLGLIAALSAVALSFFHQTETPLSSPASLQNKDLSAAKSYAISGKIYNDANGDGSMGSSESGLSGWTVKLDKPDGTSTTATTGYDGSYRFANLPPGTYMVSELQQSGWSPTTYASWKVTLSSYDVGDVSVGNKAEAKRAQAPPTAPPPASTYSISGKVFNDVDGDGARSSDDPVLSGWTIRLTCPDGTSKTETTLYNGSYKFKGLSPGTYTVSEVLQSGWSATSPASRSATISSSDEKGVSFWNTGPTETVPVQEMSEEISATQRNYRPKAGPWTLDFSSSKSFITEISSDEQSSYDLWLIILVETVGNGYASFSLFSYNEPKSVDFYLDALLDAYIKIKEVASPTKGPIFIAGENGFQAEGFSADDGETWHCAAWPYAPYHDPGSGTKVTYDIIILQSNLPSYEFQEMAESLYLSKSH